MSKLYKTIIAVSDRFVPTALRPLWEHPAGPKTVFFWAPAFKWGLVFAGLGDIYRPPDKLSIPQCLSLATTGLIWSRYSLVITPKNYNLLSVNLFALVSASLDNYRRPLDTVSTSQAATLAASGFIWTRYCFVITPVAYALAICNFMLGVANSVQFYRAYNYQRKMKAA